MLIHGPVALIPVCPVYSGTFCIGPGAPGAVDPCFKLHHPQQQADGLTALLLYLLLQINITLQTKSRSWSRSAVLSQLALSQIHFAMLNATEKKGAQFRMLAVPTLHSCTLGLQDQLNLPGAARDTNSNTEQPSTVTAYEFLTLYLWSTAQNWTRRSRDVQAVSKILWQHSFEVKAALSLFSDETLTNYFH